MMIFAQIAALGLICQAWAFVIPQTPRRVAVGRRNVCSMLVADPTVPSLARQTLLVAAEQMSQRLPPDGFMVPAAFAETVASQPVATEVAQTAATEAANKGWFDGIVWLVEQGIEGLHGILGDGSYGVSIIVFTLVIKTLTFPLNYAQIESTTRMQQLQPAVKKIQAKYSNDPQQMNLMMAQLYEENNLNPLAGCLPALVQIPVFIALYRALLSLAKEDLLEESFLWLPSLEGPVFGAQNADWLFKFDQWQNGAPPLGWHDTVAYLSLPAILVVAQSISTQLLQPPVDPKNEQAQSTNAVLKFLPLMIGFFSLNVPSGLCIYWIVNNVFTTVSTLAIRRTVMASNGPVTMGGAAIVDAPSSPPRKKARKADPKTFEDMIVSQPKPTIDVIPEPEPVNVAAVGSTAEDAASESHATQKETVDAPAPQPRSKTATKRLQKASKSRRSKKSRQ